jgi:uncharacterized protein YlxP (DUF503 family)
MIVGVCRVTLIVPESHSLKEKRMVVRSIKDRTRLKFNVAIAEVASQDNWQEAVIGFAVVANEKRFVQEMVEKVVSYIDGLALAKMVDDEKDIIQYGEGEALSQDDFAHWEPPK